MDPHEAARLLARAGSALECVAPQLASPSQMSRALDASADAYMASVGIELGAYPQEYPGALRKAANALGATGRTRKLAGKLRRAYREARGAK